VAGRRFTASKSRQSAREQEWLMLSSIYNAILNVVIPGIMLAMLIFGIYIAAKTSKVNRISAIAGISAGFVAFAIYVVSSFSNSQAPQAGVGEIPVFHWIPVAVGLVLGFAVLRVAPLLKVHASLVGLLTLFLTATGAISSFSYFFMSPSRDFTIFFGLSVLFGMLTHLALFSTLTREILQG
jgi:hypothetical protein